MATTLLSFTSSFFNLQGTHRLEVSMTRFLMEHCTLKAAKILVMNSPNLGVINTGRRTCCEMEGWREQEG